MKKTLMENVNLPDSFINAKIEKILGVSAF